MLSDEERKEILFEYMHDDGLTIDDMCKAIERAVLAKAEAEIKRLESAWHVETLNRKDQLIAKQEAENDRLKQIIREARERKPVSGVYWREGSGVFTNNPIESDLPLYLSPVPAIPTPPQAAAIPESTGIDFDFISDCLLAYKSQLYFDGAEGLRNKIDEQIAAISAAPKPEGE
jgi:hypothetical protein